MDQTTAVDPRAEWNPRSVELLRRWLRHGGVAGITATGGSMGPTLRAGDRLVVEHVSSENVAIDDVIAFYRDGRVIAHRVVRILDSRRGPFVTRGDALDSDDPPVEFDQVIGRVLGGERSAVKVGLWRAVRRARGAGSRVKRLVVRMLASVRRRMGAPR